MKAMHFSTFNPLVFESVPELHFFTLGRKNAILQVRFFSDANNIHNVQNVFSPSRHLLFLSVCPECRLRKSVKRPAPDPCGHNTNSFHL